MKLIYIIIILNYSIPLCAIYIISYICNKKGIIVKYGNLDDDQAKLKFSEIVLPNRFKHYFENQVNITGRGSVNKDTLFSPIGQPAS